MTSFSSSYSGHSSFSASDDQAKTNCYNRCELCGDDLNALDVLHIVSTSIFEFANSLGLTLPQYDPVANSVVCCKDCHRFRADAGLLSLPVTELEQLAALADTADFKFPHFNSTNPTQVSVVTGAPSAELVSVPSAYVVPDSDPTLCVDVTLVETLPREASQETFAVHGRVIRVARVELSRTLFTLHSAQRPWILAGSLMRALEKSMFFKRSFLDDRHVVLLKEIFYKRVALHMKTAPSVGPGGGAVPGIDGGGSAVGICFDESIGQQAGASAGGDGPSIAGRDGGAGEQADDCTEAHAEDRQGSHSIPQNRKPKPKLLARLTRYLRLRPQNSA
ncbi:hypothetical protein MKEN_00599200 [Mycena kentingensis (nom. inval.)]|nr:hypothetical protein MKEN_00599200 [Mycena kentingensis (nom. inval.)]